LFYSLLGLRPSVEAWAETSTKTDKLPEPAEALLRRHFCGSALVGWGLPTWLRSFCVRQQIPFLTFEVSPIRFCQDLYLLIHTNSPGVNHFLRWITEARSSISLRAMTIRSRVALNGHIDGALRDLGSVGVFFGQVEIDLALVKHGRLRRCEEFID